MRPRSGAAEFHLWGLGCQVIDWNEGEECAQDWVALPAGGLWDPESRRKQTEPGKLPLSGVPAAGWTRMFWHALLLVYRVLAARSPSLPL